MSKHLERDLDRLKREILDVGSMVGEGIDKAIRALAERRPELVEAVVAGDDRIDAREVEVEENCLKILALHQPVAADLRFIIAVLKVNNDLERMGDLACNIAERARYLSGHEPVDTPVDFPAMLDEVRVMVHGSLDALVNRDPDLAREVCARDDTVDEAHRHMFEVLEQTMRDDPDTIPRAIHMLSASRNLERIADLATNIAEDVIFLVEGEVVRHEFRGHDT